MTFTSSFAGMRIYFRPIHALVYTGTTPIRILDELIFFCNRASRHGR